MTEHDRLLKIMPCRPEDYEPWGNVERERPDCSSGCKFARWLEGEIQFDWCVCTNPASHRVGLLTFEHQGCVAFEATQDISKHFRVHTERQGSGAGGVQHKPYSTRAECLAYLDGLYPGRDRDPEPGGRWRVLPETVAWIQEYDLDQFGLECDVGRPT